MAPVQVKAEVMSMRRVGEYYVMTLTAAGIAELTRPGHFVAARGRWRRGATLLRRAFSIYHVQERGVYGGTVEIVFAVHGAGTEWMAQLRPPRPRRHRRTGRQAVRAAARAGQPRLVGGATGPRRCSPSPTS